MTIYPSVANGEPINSDELTFKRGNLFSLFFRPWTFQLNEMMKIDAEEFVWIPLKYFGGSLWRDNKVFAKPVNLFHRGIRFSWNAEAGFISSYFLKGKGFFVKKINFLVFTFQLSSLSSFLCQWQQSRFVHIFCGICQSLRKDFCRLGWYLSKRQEIITFIHVIMLMLSKLNLS